MTESEAVEKLKNMRLFMQIEDEKSKCKFTEDDYKANEMAIQALEKQTLKKPLHIANLGYTELWLCPVCERRIIRSDLKYCHQCGQKLDWSDEE